MGPHTKIHGWDWYFILPPGRNCVARSTAKKLRLIFLLEKQFLRILMIFVYIIYLYIELHVNIPRVIPTGFLFFLLFLFHWFGFTSTKKPLVARDRGLEAAQATSFSTQRIRLCFVQELQTKNIYITVIHIYIYIWWIIMMYIRIHSTSDCLICISRLRLHTFDYICCF